MFLQLSPETLRVLMWAIFAVTYVGIALGEIPGLVLDRTGIAILGAIAMLFVGAVDIHQAAASIDHETILLLFGLMIFSAQLRVAGFYALVGRRLTRLAERPRVLLAGLIAVAAVLSALLANDIVCLAFTPLLCTALLPARRNPVPYLLALATGSNIGSAATLIGNPQNMYIGTVAQLHFAHYLLTMLVPVAVGLILCYTAVAVLFRHELAADDYAPPGAPAPARGAKHRPTQPGDAITATSLPLSTPADEPAVDGYLIGKTLLLLGIVVAFFLLARGGHAAQLRAVAALVGAGVLLASRRSKAARLHQMVDYNLILLFLGLFVVNGAMKDRHLTDQMFSLVRAAHVDLSRPLTLSAVTTALSNLVSNVPAVLLLQPSVNATSAQAHSARPWYLLALVSTWAGNLTLVGSIANLIVVESAAPFGVRLTLGTYCRVGIPLTLLTVALGTLWLLLVM